MTRPDCIGPPLAPWGAKGEPQPTVERPYEFINHTTGPRRNNHAWVYVVNGSWRIEHCVQGVWQACRLIIYGSESRLNVDEAARRHLRIRFHPGNCPVRLAGTRHAPYPKGKP